MKHRKLVTYEIAGRAGDMGVQVVSLEYLSESHF